MCVPVLCVWAVCTGVCVCGCVRSRASQTTSPRAKRGERTEKKNFPEKKKAVREENLGDVPRFTVLSDATLVVRRSAPLLAGALPLSPRTVSPKLLRPVPPSRPEHPLRVRV